jgi:hypothetical protein
MISPTQRPLPDDTQRSQETNIHANGRIRTHNHSKRATANPRGRPRSHWDRLIRLIIPTENFNSYYSYKSDSRVLLKAYEGLLKHKAKSNPITDLDRPWMFQEVEAPRFQEHRNMKVVCCQLYAPAVFIPKKYSWYSFLLEAASTPGPCGAWRIANE